MYRIGEFSRLCRIPVRTMRFYDEQGLLTPDRIDAFTGYRYYSAARLEDCERIRVLKELGMGLDEIKRCLRGPEKPDMVRLIDVRLGELADGMDRLESLKKQIMEDGKVYNVTVKQPASFRAAVIREVFGDREGALSRLGALRDSLSAAAGKRSFIINYQTEYGDENPDLLIGVETSGNGSPDADGVRDISFAHTTLYAACREGETEGAYRSVSRYAAENGYQVIGAFHEILTGEAVEVYLPVIKLADTDSHVNDDIDVPFEDDERMHGRWEYADCVPSREHFNPDRQKNTSEPWMKEIYCLPGGQNYWVLGWTKGYIFTHSGYPETKYRHSCELEEIDGQRYMFVYMKTYGYESRGGLPVVWVFRQTFAGEVKRDDIRVRDNTDFPYVPDPSVLGEWKVCDFVEHMEQFSPGARYFPKEALFFNCVRFEGDGKCAACYGTDSKREYAKEWTKGIILDKRHELAEHYEIKKLGEKDFLFVEWKSGDYQFGGRRPWYYVFERG